MQVDPHVHEADLSTSIVLDRIVAERNRQDTKWGVQNHSPYTWLVIMMEEVGEVAERALALGWERDPAKREEIEAELQDEAVQVAAVAVAFVECLIRGDWRRRSRVA